MEKRDCTKCAWLSNFGCLMGLSMFTTCEWFVPFEEVDSYLSDDPAGRTSAAAGGEGRTAGPVEDEDRDKDKED